MTKPILRRLSAPRYALAISIIACLIVYLLLLGCTSAPPREVSLSWVLSPNPAATCASLKLPYRDGGCVVVDGSRCTIITPESAVRFAALGRQARACLQDGRSDAK